ncbi:MAG TPA: hypothetical protein PLZ58_00940 [Candidatus Saccharibacteria bacterium]|nr:hypothetical protein [Candidatus Saccharibacteria bacterium]HRQ07113.1 hypothetical protein [Candidatus Saccharibacteria bacterium]
MNQLRISSTLSSKRIAIFTFFATISVFTSIVLILLTPQQTANAVSLDSFKPGRIIDDAVMSNKNTMTETAIQTFLKSKVSSCTSKGNNNYINQLTIVDNGTRGYVTGTMLVNGERVPATWWWNLKDGHFVCMADDTFDGETAAHIIWQAAQDYSINPQVLIVLLEKEQGLISDGYPNNHQYAAATGFDCPDNGNGCSSANAGFKMQIRKAAALFREVLDGGWSNYPVGSNDIQYNPNKSCGSSIVTIENRATSALYRYTPYQPNNEALAAGYGSALPCGAYGNRNFYLYFNDWFGSTFAFIYSGVDFSTIFDADYYLNRYPDVRGAVSSSPIDAFDHFIKHGMSEGRQASERFNAISYKDRYPDLRAAFGNDIVKYAIHYILHGMAEGRTATGNKFVGVSSYKGVDYSLVYDFNYYINTYSDLKAAFGTKGDLRAIEHFVQDGMAEGRSGRESFNVISYKDRYPDLRAAFGNYLPAYYLHYIQYGYKEGRTATGNKFVGVSSYKGVDYSLVYDFNYYINTYSDLKAAFGTKGDLRAIEHFVQDGMAEGRSGRESFNVISYKDRYPDLRAAFGNYLPAYYLHYIQYGYKEGRTAN